VRGKEEARLRHASQARPGTLIIAAPSLMLASKNRDYRAAVLLKLEAIATVLDQLGLTRSSALARFAASPSEFILNTEDLVEEQANRVSAAICEWLGNIERWQPDAERSLPRYVASLTRRLQRRER